MRVFYDNVIFCIQRYGGVSRCVHEIIRRIERYKDIKVDKPISLRLLPRRMIRLNMLYIDFILSTRLYDIYHPTYYSESVRTRKGIKKIVVTVHDLVHELFPHRFKEHGIGIETKKRSILNADHIICVSNTTKRDLMRVYDIKEDRISVVHHGASFNEDVLPYTKGSQARHPYLLYVGKRTSYKNFNILARVFSQLSLKKDFDLICFGGGKFSSEEKAEFNRLGLENSVRYLEGTDRMLKFYYTNARAFIVTSLYEGFGIPLLEAMANGCPVVASSGGAIPEVVGDAALLFSPEDHDELSSRLQSVLRSTELRDRYVAKGRERIKNFSWDKAARETFSAYKKVLGN